VGDKKGGVFLRPQGREGLLWKIEVFDDHSGALITSGPFRLQGFARATLIPEEFARWDGQALELKDGSRLVLAK
jgi:hypothetical protein